MPYRGNYIGGRFTRPNKGVELISEDPGDLVAPVGRLIVSPEVAGAAVEQAAKAFPKWSSSTPASRRAKLKAFQRVLKRRKHDLMVLLAREAGKPIQEAEREVQRSIEKIDEMVGAGLKLLKPYSVAVERGVQGQCRYRPLGVMAVIGPFNFPSHTPASHIIPAVLTGNTVVFKPSEYTPFIGQCLAECLHAAGFPAGVFNLVQGGSEVGKRLVEHPAISAVLFTGSTAAGQSIRSANIKNPRLSLALEMGGKNAGIVLRDADLDLAARETALAAFSMSGQRCNATSRILVERSVLKPFLEKFLHIADRIRMGYPMEEGVVMGPLISHDAIAKFQRYMKLADEEGFEALRKGKALGKWGNRRGYYVTPSVHLCEKPGRSQAGRYRTEEIFGPDVAIYAVKDEAEAVAINNEVSYGLITSVFTRSKNRFQKLLGAIDTGMVNFNRGTIFSSGKLPFGGTKASGSHHPTGMFAPYYCTHPVAVLQDSRPLALRAYPF